MQYDERTSVELRTQVERTVRPLRASGWRKRKMREELLSHLQQSVEAKGAAGQTLKEATGEAIKEMGDPDTLRRELQTTIPWAERICYLRLPGAEICDRWFDKTKGESTYHFALHRTIWTSAFLAAILLTVWLALAVLGTNNMLPSGMHYNPSNALEKLGILFLCFLTQVGATAMAYCLVDLTGLRTALSKQRALNPLWKGAAMGAFIAGYLALVLVAAAPLLLFGGDARAVTYIQQHFLSPAPLLSLAALVVLGLPFLGWVMVKEHEFHERWGKLHIEE